MTVAIWRARRSRSIGYRYRSGPSSGSPASAFSSPHKIGRSVPARERKRLKQERNQVRSERAIPAMIKRAPLTLPAMRDGLLLARA